MLEESTRSFYRAFGFSDDEGYDGTCRIRSVRLEDFWKGVSKLKDVRPQFLAPCFTSGRFEEIERCHCCGGESGRGSG